MHRLILFALFGAAAQAVDGSLGMGFGVTSSSLLLSLGVGSALTSASVHIAELVTSSISGVSHVRIGNRDRRHERLGVRVQRAQVNLIAVGQFHDLAQVHDRDTI